MATEENVKTDFGLIDRIAELLYSRFSYADDWDEQSEAQQERWRDLAIDVIEEVRGRTK